MDYRRAARAWTLGLLLAVVGCTEPRTLPAETPPGEPVPPPDGPAAPVEPLDCPLLPVALEPRFVPVSTGSKEPPFDYWRSQEVALSGTGEALVAAHGGTIASATWRRFDPRSRQWSLPTGLDASQRGPLTVLASGDVLVSPWYRSLSEARYREPTWLQTWPRASSLVLPFPPSPPGGPFRPLDARVLLPDGRVLSAGGSETLYGVPDGSSLRLDPADGSWTLAAAPRTPRHSPKLVLLRDGRVLMVGGTVPNPSMRRVAPPELYDPVRDAWSPTAPTPGTAAPEGSVALLPDGRVLVSGCNAGFFLYAPETDQWQQLDVPLSCAQATVLASGKVLLLGRKRASDGREEFDHAALLDPATLAVSALPHPVRHVWPGLRLLPTNEVLVADETGSELFHDGAPSLPAPELQQAEVSLGERVTLRSKCAPDQVSLERPDGALLSVPFVQQGTELSLTLPAWVGVGVHWLRIHRGGAVSSAQPLRVGRALGRACGSGRECGSGFCVDGVCCESVCSAGPCDACAVAAGAASDGRCTPLSGAVCDDESACTEGDTCVAGSCVGTEPLACFGPQGPATCEPRLGACTYPVGPAPNDPSSLRRGGGRSPEELDWGRVLTALRGEGRQELSSAAHNATGEVLLVGHYESALQLEAGTLENHGTWVFYNESDGETLVWDHDAFAVKLGPDGAVRWAQGWGEAGTYTLGGASALSASGRATLVVRSSGASQTLSPLRSSLVQLDPEGALRWRAPLECGDCSVEALQALAGEGVAALVRYQGALTLGGAPLHAAGTAFLVAGFDADGAVQWVHALPGGFTPSSLGGAPEGGVLVAGTLDATAADGARTWRPHLVALDGAGQPRWQHTVQALEHAQQVSAAVLPDGALALTGTFTGALVGPRLTLRADGPPAAYLLVLEPGTHAVRWTKRLGYRRQGEQSAYPGSLVVGAHGELHALVSSVLLTLRASDGRLLGTRVPVRPGSDPYSAWLSVVQLLPQPSGDLLAVGGASIDTWVGQQTFVAQEDWRDGDLFLMRITP